MAMLLKIPFSFQCSGGRGRSLLAGWDFLPCVMVSGIAMSHFKDLMWVDGWSPTREWTVVKIPINEGQRNMTWTASGLYLAMTESVDCNCIPSALGRGSALRVSAGRLYFLGSCPWAYIQDFIPYSLHVFKLTSALQKFFFRILPAVPLTVTEVTRDILLPVCFSAHSCAEVQPWERAISGLCISRAGQPKHRVAAGDCDVVLECPHTRGPGGTAHPNLGEHTTHHCQT